MNKQEAHKCGDDSQPGYLRGKNLKGYWNQYSQESMNQRKVEQTMMDQSSTFHLMLVMINAVTPCLLMRTGIRSHTHPKTPISMSNLF